MANNQLKGLFGGPSASQVRHAMLGRQQAQEQDAFKTMLAGTGGNVPAAVAARARQGKMNAIGNIGHGIARGMGLEDRRSPELNLAVKRDTDKAEIMDMLGQFTTPGSDGGEELSEKEIKMGFGELMKRGYNEEAQKWLKMAQSMQGMSLKERQVDAQELSAKATLAKALKGDAEKVKWGTTRVIRDSKGQKFFSVQMRDGKDVKTVYTPIGGNNPEAQPEGATEITNDNVGQTGEEKLSRALLKVLGRGQEARKTESHKDTLKRGTAEFTEELKRTTAELQSELNINENEAKKFSDHVLSTRTENMKAGNVARRGVSKVKAMLEYAKVMKSGGNAAAAWKTVKRVFGYEGKDSAAFRTRGRMQLIKDLRKLMGARPTDVDLQKMEGAYPTEDQPIQANIAILEDMLERYNQEIDTGDWWADNKDGTPRQFSKYLKKKYEVKIPTSSENDPLGLR